VSELGIAQLTDFNVGLLPLPLPQFFPSTYKGPLVNKSGGLQRGD